MRRSILQKIGEEEDGVMSELPYMRRNGVFCACVLGATTEGDWSKQKPRLYTIFELRHTGARARVRSQSGRRRLTRPLQTRLYTHRPLPILATYFSPLLAVRRVDDHPSLGIHTSWLLPCYELRTLWLGRMVSSLGRSSLSHPNLSLLLYNMHPPECLP